MLVVRAGGIPSFFFDFEGGTIGGGKDDPDSQSFSSGRSYVATSSDDNNYSYSDPYESSNTYGTDTYTPPSSDNDDVQTMQNPLSPPSSTDTVNFSTTTVPVAHLTALTLLWMRYLALFKLQRLKIRPKEIEQMLI